MAAAELEHHESETDVVRRWRFDELLRAGYDIADAASAPPPRRRGRIRPA